MKTEILNRIDSFIEKSKVYVESNAEAPRGVAVLEGPRGGLYYDTSKLTKPLFGESGLDRKEMYEYINTLSSNEKVNLAIDSTFKTGSFTKATIVSNLTDGEAKRLLDFLSNIDEASLDKNSSADFADSLFSLIRFSQSENNRQAAFEVYKKKLHERYPPDPDILTGEYDKDISVILKNWCWTSSDADSMHLQAAVNKIFNNKEYTIISSEDEFGQKYIPEEKYVTAAKKLYDETQEFYKKQGVKTLQLYRGLRLGDEQYHKREIRESLPLTSWTIDKREASKFAHDQSKYGKVLVANVPIEDVLFSYETHGDINEITKEALKTAKEVVVIRKQGELLFKSHVYVESRESAPEGVVVQEGKRGGLYYETSTKPKETKNLYDEYLHLDHNFLWRGSKASQKKAFELNTDIDKQRSQEFTEAKNQYMKDAILQWVNGSIGMLITMRKIVCDIQGQNIPMEELKDFLSNVQGIKRPVGLKEAEDTYKASLAVFYNPYAKDQIESLYKSEKDFTVKRTKELFGNEITVYRKIYGNLASKIRETLKTSDKIDLDEFPLSSYSQDLSGALGFSNEKDYIIFKRKVSSEDIFSAWYSNPSFNEVFPSQKEVIVNSKDLKFSISKEDIVYDSKY